MQEDHNLDSPVGETPARSNLWSALAWVRDLAFSVIIAVVLIVFIYQPVKVEGTSMMPALTDQERIFINKFTYRFGLGSIERGDTVVFWWPPDPAKSYIKRVIGLPGDTVRIDAGHVTVNGRPLVEDYVPEEYRDRVSWGPRAGASRQLFRPGRPPHVLQRQPHLGVCQPERHLRQSRVYLLAAGQDRPAAVTHLRKIHNTSENSALSTIQVVSGK
jgi:signal peptidase I